MEPPFVGPSYNLDSRPASVQRTVNLIPVPQEPGNERTTWVFKDVPGLVLLTAFSPTPSDNDWLGFDADGNTKGPTNQNNGAYLDITGSLVPFSFGATISRNSANGAEDPPQMVVPLSGPAEAPDIVEGVNWFPATAGSSVVPSLSQDDPSPGGIWGSAGANWFLTLEGSPIGEFDGGVLKLFGSGVRVTLITFGNYYANQDYGQDVTIEYADSTPPAAPDAQEVSLPFTGAVPVGVNDGHWYTFTLDATALMQLDTIGTPSDTMIALFNEVGNLIESDDDDGGSGTSLISRSLTAGQYYVFVCGYQATFADGWDVNFPGTSFASTVSVSFAEVP